MLGMLTPVALLECDARGEYSRLLLGMLSLGWLVFAGVRWSIFDAWQPQVPEEPWRAADSDGELLLGEERRPHQNSLAFVALLCISVPPAMLLVALCLSGGFGCSKIPPSSEEDDSERKSPAVYLAHCTPQQEQADARRARAAQNKQRPHGAAPAGAVDVPRQQRHQHIPRHHPPPPPPPPLLHYMVPTCQPTTLSPTRPVPLPPPPCRPKPRTSLGEWPPMPPSSKYPDYWSVRFRRETNDLPVVDQAATSNVW